MSSYDKIIANVFFDNYEEGDSEVSFQREEMQRAAMDLGLERPKNLGDVVYTFRYRRQLPESIVATAASGKEWVIRGTGQAEYQFRQVTLSRISPSPALMTIKVPNATPEVVLAHALSDEQALLAKVRYNRLIDVFLGVTAYSLQSHLRTTVSNIGQIEIDEIYVAIDSSGQQYVLPVQAKGGSDRLSVIQSEQDIAYCAEKYPSLICRAISTQFMEDDLIAMFEVVLEDDQVKVAVEKHYRLVAASDISDEDLRKYGKSAR